MQLGLAPPGGVPHLHEKMIGPAGIAGLSDIGVLRAHSGRRAERWHGGSESEPRALTHTKGTGTAESLRKIVLADLVQTKGLGSALYSAR